MYQWAPKLSIAEIKLKRYVVPVAPPPRGGLVDCQPNGDRVSRFANAVKYMEGDIYL
jgi:hypothetical protein